MIVFDGVWDSETGTETISSPMYKNPELRWLYVIGHSLIRALIGVLGVVFNGFLVFITVKHRHLRNTCGYLLAAEALANSMSVANGFATLFYTLDGQLKVSQIKCFWTISGSIVAFVASFVLMLAIAVDRLISVLKPIWYKKLNRLVYIGVILWCSTVFGCAIFVLGLRFMTTRKSFLCTIDRILFWEYGNLVNIVCLSFNAATVACYLGIFLALRYSKSTSTHSTRKILRSLVTIVTVVVVCWMLVMMERLLQTTLFPRPTATAYLVWTGCGTLLSLTQAIVNPTVLYFTSQVYRKVMRVELRHLALFVSIGTASYYEAQRKQLIQLPPISSSRTPPSPLLLTPLPPNRSSNSRLD